MEPVIVCSHSIQIDFIYMQWNIEVITTLGYNKAVKAYIEWFVIYYFV